MFLCPSIYCSRPAHDYFVYPFLKPHQIYVNKKKKLLKNKPPHVKVTAIIKYLKTR